MKLVQLNVWGGRLEYLLHNFIQQVEPEIMCLQEIHELRGTSGALFATLSELGQAGKFEYTYMSPAYTFQFQQREVHFGNALLSRFPLGNTDTQFVTGSYKEDFDEAVDEFDIRNFQHATIKSNGKNVHIINFHGSFIVGSKLGNEQTLEHMQRIIEYTQDFIDEPILIVGDFNLAPESESIRRISDHFRDLTADYNVQSTYSPVLHVFDIVCDYIFVNQHVSVTDFKVSDDIISDHKALILEFTV